MLPFIGKLWAATLRLKKVNDYCNIYSLRRHFDHVFNLNNTIVRYIIDLRGLALKKISLNIPPFAYWLNIFFTITFYLFLFFTILVIL